jgi:hypothetical protein
MGSTVEEKTFKFSLMQSLPLAKLLGKHNAAQNLYTHFPKLEADINYMDECGNRFTYNYTVLKMTAFL